MSAEDHRVRHEVHGLRVNLLCHNFTLFRGVMTVHLKLHNARRDCEEYSRLDLTS